MKPGEFGIKTYELYDSTNSYCLVFVLYIGQTNVAPPFSKHGKMHSLVISLLERYTGKGYIVYMDNKYSSPYFFIICCPRIQLPVTRSVFPEKAFPKILVLQSSRSEAKLYYDIQ